MQTTLRIGDKAVYPAHGVGEVTAIEKHEIAGIEQTFYVLRILGNQMTVMVPTNNIRQVGLREVISKEDIEKVFKILRAKETAVDGGTWNRRYREYVEKLKTGSILEVAKVFRDLRSLGSFKELSFGERKLLDTARNLLSNELACAKSCTVRQMDEELDKLFPHKLLSAA